MRRIARLERSIDRLRVSSSAQIPSPYLCYACKHRAAPFSTSATRSKVSLTERVRRKIWGTDEPPGLKDPYGSGSHFDRTKKTVNEEIEEEEEEEERHEARVPRQDNYEPASTWDGLEQVGGFGGWWKANWDPEHTFTGFLPREVMSNSAEISAALHRAMVEVFALQQVGQPLDSISKNGPGEDLTQDVQVLGGRTDPTLQFSGSSTLEDIVQSLAQPLAPAEGVEEGAPTESEEDLDADKSEEDPLHPEITPATIEESEIHENPTESVEDIVADRSPINPLLGSTRTNYDELVATWDPSWLQVSLEHPDVKFAVIKRTMQLTGLRIPDSAVKSSRTAQALLAHLIKPPKPRKVIDSISENEVLQSLPNVQVFEKRITPIDRETSVGRWKIIERELQRRDLPITGR